jgi:hypothetical protein
MSHPDQPVEISHEDLHLADTKHWNNEGKDNCNGSQNSEPLGEYGNNTRGQKCKSDEYTNDAALGSSRRRTLRANDWKPSSLSNTTYKCTDMLTCGAPMPKADAFSPTGC